MARVNKAELAELLGFSERWITDLQDEGLPIAVAGERGLANAYDVAACVKWLIDRAERRVRGESARDDLYRSQKRLADIRIAEAEGRLVDAAEVESGFARMVVAARTDLLRLPATLADQLQDVLDRAHCQALISQGIEQALTEISRYVPREAVAA